ncbi:hypothetical protein CKN73_03020 [Carnobacterium divergens]|uniref:Ig-like domain-containing protein n=1 Tax=Carnobacterium divergens TaxID=2748 RepID=UPI001072C3DE|nr:Ig-like domain-containing protein [Carnobacterium divergens]TFJ51457.1 hypothetical protein CKN73_03020 [Carnobacterium divergens]
MKKNKLMQIFLLVTLLLNTVLPSLVTTVSAESITKRQTKAGTGTISAVFFEDLNGNQKQDPTEAGVSGVTVTLTDGKAEQVIATKVTDSDGRYTFSNLPAGTYYLTVKIPEGHKAYTQGPLGFGKEGNTTYFDLAEGETQSGAWQGLFPTTASVKGTAYLDANRNGRQDVDESGIAGLEASLFEEGTATSVQTTTTDAQGRYSFSKLNPGTQYNVEIKFSSDYVVIATNYFNKSGKSEPIRLGSEEVLENVNLGLYKDVPVGSINVNPTILDKLVGDSGTLTTRIFPENATDKTVTYTSEDSTIMTVDANGNWTAKKAGTTKLKVTSNGDPTKFVYVTVTVTDKNASTISGQIQKEDGSGFSGIHVELREPGSDKLIQQMTTSVDGNYSFKELSKMNYYIQATIPNDYKTKYGYNYFDSTGRTVYLHPDGINAISGVNLQLEPKQILPDSIKVSPKVIDTRVNETGQLTVDFLPTNTTNKDLVYRVSDVSILSVDANGKWTAKKPGKATITVVSASGAQDTVEVTVRSFTNSHIAGKIVDPNGKPVSGVDLVIYSWDGKLIGQKTTDATGAYRFDSLEAMEYYVKIQVPTEYELAWSSHFWGDSTGYLRVDGSNSIDNVDAVIKLINPKDSALSGTIYDQTNNGVGFGGVQIQLVNVLTGKMTQTTTNANGTYSFPNLEKAYYYMKIVAPTNYEYASSVQFYQDLTTAYITIDGLAKQEGFDASLKAITPKNNSSIKGVITNQETGLGFPGVQLSLYSGSNGLEGTTITAADGSYNFTGLTPADYYVKLTFPTDYQLSHSNFLGSDGVSGYKYVDGANQLTEQNATLKKIAIEAESITVEPKELNQLIGDTGKLTVTFQPSNTTDKNVNFTSKNPNVITIDKDGNWIATGVGTTTIEVTTSNGKKETVKVTVKSKQESSISGKITNHSTGLGFEEISMKLYTSDGKLVSEAITDVNGHYSFEGLSKNDYYVILGVPEGQVMFTSNTFGADGVSGFYAIDGSNKVTDRNATLKPKDIPAVGITVEPKELNQFVGDTGKLAITFQPGSTTDKSLNFVSGKPEIMTIDKDGNWIATGVGTTTIEVTTSNGKKATVKVTVKSKQESSISGVITNHSTGLGLSEITLKLYTFDGKLASEVITDMDGQYSFVELSKSDYYIVLSVPEGQEMFYSNTFGSDGVSGFYAIDGSNKMTDRNATLKSKDIPAIGITVEPKELNQVVGDTGKLAVTFQPGSTTDKSLNFVSDDPTVMTIDKDGNWIATGVGTTTITVTTSNGKTETVKVTVTAKEIPAESITVEPKELKQIVGDTGKLAITFQPENTTDKSLNFVSGKPEIMTIDKDGNWIATGVGTTTITVTTSNGKTTTVAVTVKAKQESSISGVITRQSTGAGVAGVILTLYTSDQKAFGEVTTNAKGEYIFANLPASEYYIVLSVPDGQEIAQSDTFGSDGVSGFYTVDGSNKLVEKNATLKTKDVLAESITAEPKELNQVVGDTGKLTITFQPSNTADKSLNFVSEDPTVMTIDKDGNWIATGVGTTIITVTTSNGKKTTVKVTVKAKEIPAESITAEPKELNQIVGDTGKLAITFQPGNTTDKSLNFVSEDPTVMTIDKAGNWIATGVGTTTIIVTTSNGKKTTVKVIVKAKEIPAESITAEPKELNQIVGDTGKLAITFQPSNTTDKSLNFVSQHPEIMTIDSEGNWVARAEGTTVITITTSNGKLTHVFVTVKAKNVPAESITVEPKELNQFVGDTGKLAITFQPSNTTDKSLSFVSRNPEIMTVDSNGNWTAVKEGSTIITVTTSNGKTAFVFVTVKAKDVPAESITAEPKELNQIVGDTGKLAITFQPSNTTDKSLNFVSQHPEIMTIDSEGNWVARAEGTTVITVTTSNGKLTHVFVTVKAKNVPAESITVEPKELNQFVGDTGKLAITFQPSNTTDKSLSFVSRNPEIMTVDSNGNWTAVNEGTTVITVTTSNGKTAFVFVTVKAKDVPAESITAEPKELNQTVGDTGKLAITFQPSNTTDKSLNFVSRNPEIMTVDNNGNWTAVKEGTTVITVTTSNGKTALVFVTVKANGIPVESITVEPKELNQLVGDTGKLAITFQPSNATDKSLNFVSNDPSIMTIDSNGNWTAMKEGSTVITVTTSNGKLVTVQVTVKEVVKNGVHVLYEDYPMSNGAFIPKSNGYENTGFDHDFGASEPYRGLGPDHYRITKIGYVKIKEDGRYGFKVEVNTSSNDAAYVGINDKQIINFDPKIGGEFENQHQYFKKGDVIKIEIRHFHRDPTALSPFKLKWTVPSNQYSYKSIDVSEITQTPN